MKKLHYIYKGVFEMNNNLVENFLEFLQNDKKLSDNTLQSYRRDIVQYKNYVEDNKINYTKVKNEDIVKFLCVQR